MKWLFFAILIVVLVGSYANGVVNHEEVHRQIFQGDGCSEVKVVYTWRSYTICSDSSYVESSEAYALQVMNEIERYNNSSRDLLLAGILLMLFVLVVQHER